MLFRSLKLISEKLSISTSYAEFVVEKLRETEESLYRTVLEKNEIAPENLVPPVTLSPSVRTSTVLESSSYYRIISEIARLCRSNPEKSEQFVAGAYAAAEIIRAEFKRQAEDKVQSIFNPNQIPLDFD
mgnify:FL=1